MEDLLNAISNTSNSDLQEYEEIMNKFVEIGESYPVTADEIAAAIKREERLMSDFDAFLKERDRTPEDELARIKQIITNAAIIFKNIGYLGVSDLLFSAIESYDMLFRKVYEKERNK